MLLDQLGIVVQQALREVKDQLVQQEIQVVLEQLDFQDHRVQVGVQEHLDQMEILVQPVLQEIVELQDQMGTVVLKGRKDHLVNLVNLELKVFQETEVPLEVLVLQEP